MALKRYLLFTFKSYYPGGGWCDFRDSYDSEDEARRVATSVLSADDDVDNANIADTKTGDWVNLRRIRPGWPPRNEPVDIVEHRYPAAEQESE